MRAELLLAALLASCQTKTEPQAVATPIAAAARP